MEFVSSNIQSGDYDEASKTLLITFNTGRRYEHYGVPQELWEALKDAGSKGRFYSQFIKGKFAYAEV
jgi:hypothetical protein